MNHSGKFYFTIVIVFLVSACQWGPKEREIVLPGGLNKENIDRTGLYFDLHRVKVLDALEADTYVYLEVSEGKRTFWIAARNAEIKKDSIYYYREALLKTEFESKQHQRVFDSIYLVTNLVPESHFKMDKDTFHN